jgi:hypothetical protein
MRTVFLHISIKPLHSINRELGVCLTRVHHLAGPNKSVLSRITYFSGLICGDRSLDVVPFRRGFGLPKGRLEDPYALSDNLGFRLVVSILREQPLKTSRDLMTREPPTPLGALIHAALEGLFLFAVL